MPQLLVKKKLNKRSEIPATLPQEKGIVDAVPQGHIFWGELVKDIPLPSPPLDKWYRDEKGFYYWGGALDVITGRSSANSASLQWWGRALQLGAVQDLTLPLISPSNPVTVAVLDSGLSNINNIDASFIITGKKNFAENNDNIIDTKSGHGTLCTSIIAGNTEMFNGINAKVNVFVGKIISKADCIAKAINFIADNNDTLKIDIISYSGGVSKEQATPELEQAIRNAIQKSIIIVCAVGNVIQNSVGFFPAMYPDVISIGALNEKNEFSKILNPSTNKIDFCTPGENVKAINVLSCEKLDKGTSQSCALMSGLLSLVIAKAKSRGQKWNNDDAKSFLKKSSQEILSPNSLKMQRIDPDKLLKNLKNI